MELVRNTSTGDSAYATSAVGFVVDVDAAAWQYTGCRDRQSVEPYTAAGAARAAVNALCVEVRELFHDWFFGMWRC